MAVNKNAQIRYKALDKCFSNQYKRFFIKDLIEYCSNILSEHYAVETTVSRRQIFDDMDFMRSEAGFDAPIESLKEGRKVYYRYADPEFSIQKSPINPQELDSLKEALATLNRLNSLPGFDWVASLQAKLQSGLKKETENLQIISFEENEFLKGLEYLNLLFQFIINQQTLEIAYKSFKSETESIFVISPYFLKQYNNRWFLFGWNHNLQIIQNLALDRIIALNTSKNIYIESDTDFKEFFEDIIGVSNDFSKPVVEVVIELKENIVPYIQSKPLHGSQRLNKNILSLRVKLNYELETTILSFGENMRVLSPSDLVQKIKLRVVNLINQY